MTTTTSLAGQLITVTMLQQMGACSEAVSQFAQDFPNGTVLTEAICQQYATVFPFGWIFENLLTPQQQYAFAANAGAAFFAALSANLPADAPAPVGFKQTL